MEARDDAWAVVIVGHWNRMIFTPAWVAEKLFKAPEIERLVPIMPDAPLVYRNDDVELHVVETRLSLKVRQGTAECLAKAADMAREICGLLPNTPVIAVGINFGFTEAQPDEPLLQLFNADDVTQIEAEGWRVETRTLMRQLAKDGQTLNLVLRFQTEEVQVDANFHRSVTTAGNAIAALADGRIQELHGMLLALLGEAYGLNAIAGEANV